MRKGLIYFNIFTKIWGGDGQTGNKTKKKSNYLRSHTGWTALSEIITQGTFPSLLLFGWKKRSCSSQIFIYSFNIIHFFVWPFFYLLSFYSWFPRCLLIFSQFGSTMEWDVIWVQLTANIIEGYMRVLSGIRVSTKHKGKNSIFFLFQSPITILSQRCSQF